MSSTRRGVVNVPIAAVLWGSSGVCVQYIMEQSQASSQLLTMMRLISVGFTLLMLSFVHDDKVLSIIRNRKGTINLSTFSVVGALTIQLTSLLAIEKSNVATVMVLQFLSPTIITAWFSMMREARSGIPTLTAIFISLVGTSPLVIHGSPTSLSTSPVALFWGTASAFAAAFYTTYPSTPIACYGILPVVGWGMLIGGIVLLPFYVGQGASFVVSGSLILVLFYPAVTDTSLTSSLYLKSAQTIGGPKTSILNCAGPLSSALLSLLLLGITFTLPDWLDTLLILSSVMLISMDSRRHARAA